MSTNNNDTIKDTEWKEHEVHVENENDGATNDECFAMNHLFETNDEEEVLEFNFNLENDDDDNNNKHRKNSNPTITLKGHTEITNSTGLSVWLGAEVLCDFLLKNRPLVDQKSVLELGAGLGLTGILVAKHLKASRTVLTDGDSGVLRNLRSNMERNDALSLNIACPQLIWGRDLEEFRQQYGRFQVLLATDCVYMTKSLEPLWKTAHALLEETADAVVVYVNLCSSQAPHEEVVEVAKRFGFSSTNPSKDVYLFRRKV